MSIAVKIDNDLGKRAEILFSELGLDLNTAVNIFLTQSLRQERIPFTIGLNDYDEAYEDFHDAKIADEAYEEYVADGCKSRPISELFREVGIR